MRLRAGENRLLGSACLPWAVERLTGVTSRQFWRLPDSKRARGAPKLGEFIRAPDLTVRLPCVLHGLKHRPGVNLAS